MGINLQMREVSPVWFGRPPHRHPQKATTQPPLAMPEKLQGQSGHSGLQHHTLPLSLAPALPSVCQPRGPGEGRSMAVGWWHEVGVCGALPAAGSGGRPQTAVAFPV